jgi:hypothetical protein
MGKRTAGSTSAGAVTCSDAIGVVAPSEGAVAEPGAPVTSSTLTTTV